MERHQHQDIDRIRQDLLRMGGLVEEMITNSMRALVERSSDVAIDVIKGDAAIDSLQKQIDEECQTVLALYQPTASDMRFLVSAMKIDTDLERMGDSAVNIAQSVLVLNQEPPLKPYVDLPRMTTLVNGMVRDALDCFVKRDSHTAIEVCKRDDEVDALYHQLFRELLTYMMEDPRAVTRALHLLLIARNLERVADHATNIAEDVVYYVEGRDIRHLGDQTAEPL
ncbi:MAG: phosphate signaling complex protein PhoU [Thermoanaerobaculia bacterium]|nr:phosphate signaling complex protein PhoU [Thermoanaerobaculia bacterium]